MTQEDVQVWFDVEIGHSVCPSDETKENCKGQRLMRLIDKYVEGVTAEKVLEARLDELTKTFTQVIGNKDAPSSRYSKVTRIFNAYLKIRFAKLQAELSKLKEEE